MPTMPMLELLGAFPEDCKGVSDGFSKGFKGVLENFYSFHQSYRDVTQKFKGGSVDIRGVQFPWVSEESFRKSSNVINVTGSYHSSEFPEVSGCLWRFLNSVSETTERGPSEIF